MMSQKLGIKGAYNRPRTLSPLSSEGTATTPNSNGETDVIANKNFKKGEGMDTALGKKGTRNCNVHGHSKLEYEHKTLQAENSMLRKELDNLGEVLRQVTNDNSHEKFDERRLNLIKLQVVQLERQIALLNESLCSRHESILEAENTMAWVADKMRSFVAAEVKGPMVPIARSDLMTIIESSEASRLKLFKAVERSDKDDVGKELLLLNPFIGGKYRQGESLSLLDVSLNRMDYVNLRHVAQLESKLSVLYKELIGIQEKLDNLKNHRFEIGHVNSLEIERLETAILKTCIKAKDASGDLLALSLLCPSAPWPALKRPLVKSIPVERIISALPTLPRLKQEEVTQLVEATLGVANHRCILLEKEKAAIKEELDFHRSVYDMQIEYMRALFEAVRKGYGEFEESARLTVAAPIQQMLDAYAQLKNSASEQALRDFLVVIKEKEQQLSSIVDSLTQQNFEKDESGSAAFSKFGEEFFTKLNGLIAQCQKQRDSTLYQKKELKQVQTTKDLELQNLIENLESKYDKQWTPLKSFQNETTSRNAVREDKISGDSLETQRSDLTTMDLPDISSAAGSANCDDPTVLRSFLYSDTRKDHDKTKKEWVGDFTEQRKETPNAPHDAKPKPKKKSVDRWKPKKDWVDDFALPSPDNSESNRERDLQQKCADKMSSDPMKCASTKKKDNKKPPLSYEPRLFVPNRTLKLRRASSLTGISTGDTSSREDEKEDNQNKQTNLDNSSITSSRQSSRR